MSHSFSNKFYIYLLYVLAIATGNDAFPHHTITTRLHNKIHLAIASKKEYIEEEALAQDIPKDKQMIEIQSHINLPFSAEIAYDAYSNLPRQRDWSSWLHNVEYIDDSLEKSRWTMKFLGFRYQWISQALKNERPHTLQWKSISGINNFGTVIFDQKDNKQTAMTLTMTLRAPRVAASIFKKSKRLAEFIEEKIILTSLRSFKDIVLETDVKQVYNT